MKRDSVDLDGVLLMEFGPYYFIVDQHSRMDGDLHCEHAMKTLPNKISTTYVFVAWFQLHFNFPTQSVCFGAHHVAHRRLLFKQHVCGVFFCVHWSDRVDVSFAFERKEHSVCEKNKLTFVGDDFAHDYLCCCFLEDQ